MISLEQLENSPPGTIVYVNQWIEGKVEGGAWEAWGTKAQNAVAKLSEHPNSKQMLQSNKGFKMSFSPVYTDPRYLEIYERKIQAFRDFHGFSNLGISKFVLRMVMK